MGTCHQRQSAWGVCFSEQAHTGLPGTAVDRQLPAWKVQGSAVLSIPLLNPGGREARRTSPSVSSSPKGPGLGRTNVSESQQQLGPTRKRMHREDGPGETVAKGREQPPSDLLAHTPPTASREHQTQWGERTPPSQQEADGFSQEAGILGMGRSQGTTVPKLGVNNIRGLTVRIPPFGGPVEVVLPRNSSSCLLPSNPSSRGQLSGCTRHQRGLLRPQPRRDLGN